jgi:hypothetical protein
VGQEDTAAGIRSGIDREDAGAGGIKDLSRDGSARCKAFEAEVSAGGCREGEVDGGTRYDRSRLSEGNGRRRSRRWIPDDVDLDAVADTAAGVGAVEDEVVFAARRKGDGEVRADEGEGIVGLIVWSVECPGGARAGQQADELEALALGAREAVNVTLQPGREADGDRRAQREGGCLIPPDQIEAVISNAADTPMDDDLVGTRPGQGDGAAICCMTTIAE